ncbi:MAG TPA: putative metal-binding motif-containing protein, partial [Nannocystis sp.]
AEDIPNGIDDDCDGIIDEGSDASDDDRDGFSELQGDCDDTNPAIKPGAVELPNGIDDDCDGEIDEGLEDRDRDGYTADEDCDDNNGWANPGQPEVCDGIDNDCVNGVDIDANGRNVCDGMMLPPQCSGGCNEDCDGDGKADNGCSAAGSRGHQRLAIALIGLVGALLRRRRAAA